MTCGRMHVSVFAYLIFSICALGLLKAAPTKHTIWEDLSNDIQLWNCTFQDALADIRAKSNTSFIQACNELMVEATVSALEFTPGPFMCMGLYDISLRLCERKVYLPGKLPSNASEFDSYLTQQRKSSVKGDVKYFCKRLSDTFMSSEFTQTKEYNSVLRTYVFGDPDQCSRLCVVTLNKTSTLNPFCEIILWGNSLLKNLTESKDAKPVSNSNQTSVGHDGENNKLKEGNKLLETPENLGSDVDHGGSKREDEYDQQNTSDEIPITPTNLPLHQQTDDTKINGNISKEEDSNENTNTNAVSEADEGNLHNEANNISQIDPGTQASSGKSEDNSLQEKVSENAGTVNTNRMPNNTNNGKQEDNNIKKQNVYKNQSQSNDIKQSQKDDIKHRDRQNNGKQNHNKNGDQSSNKKQDQSSNKKQDQSSNKKQDQSHNKNGDQSLNKNGDQSLNKNGEQSPNKNGEQSPNKNGDQSPNKNGDHSKNDVMEEEYDSGKQNENSGDDDKLKEMKSEVPADSQIFRQENFTDAEGSNFFFYFMTMIILCVIIYILFHNKQKILALALEGRAKRNDRRRHKGADYRKLNSNLEEAMTSSYSKSATNVIY